MYLNSRRGLKKLTPEHFESINYITVEHVTYILHSQFVCLLRSGLRRSNTSYNALFKPKKITWPYIAMGGQMFAY